MNNSNQLQNIASEVETACFSCLRCAACCTGPDAVVMVSPSEIRALMGATELSWDDIVTPYPEYIFKHGQKLTFGWAIRHTKEQCIFLENNRCTVYHARPWICKTYPFMLDQKHVIVSACEGLHTHTDPLSISQLTHDLIARRCAEEKEEAQVAYWYHNFTQNLPDAKTSLIVIDSEGVKCPTNHLFY